MDFDQSTVVRVDGHDPRGSDWGLRRTTWDELELVQHWKAYLDSPARYLRHVLD